jgi:hypothetical protein
VWSWRKNRPSIAWPDALPITASIPHFGHRAVCAPSIQDLMSVAVNVLKQKKQPQIALLVSSSRCFVEWV